MAPTGLAESFLAAIQASLSVLLVISYGGIAAWLHLLDAKNTKAISKICVRMFLPALLVVKIGSELHADSAGRYGIILIWAIVCHLLSFGLGAFAHLVLGMPDWTTVALMFNNTTSYPLLLIGALSETGILRSLVVTDESTQDAIGRANSYFLVFATVSSCLTFAVGPRLIDTEHGPDSPRPHDTDVANDQVTDEGGETNANERTRLLHPEQPSQFIGSHNAFFPSKRQAAEAAWQMSPHNNRRAILVPKRWWADLGPRARWWSLFIFDFFNAPLLGALVGAVIGLVHPLHHAFFSDTADGGIFTAWLTASLKNIGSLFVPLPVVVAGPDPMLWFAMMLMPTGPPAMKLITLVQISNSTPEDESSIAKILTFASKRNLGSMSGTMRGTPSRAGHRSGGGAPPYAGSSVSPANNSNIPRPVIETHHATPPPPSEVASGVSASRQKQSKRDEAIRRKLENDLQKKKHLTGRARHTRKAPPGTVLALKPSPALQIKPATTVAEAAQLMAAKREDCVLVTDDNDRIAGIFTAKDLAFRVVGTGQKAANVTIAEIMTKNPLCARTDTSATDALDLMVRKGFRHLPVMDENQEISGILDITKCFYDAMEKLERAYASSTKLYAALEGVQSELGASQPQQIIQYVEALRHKMSGPTLESVLNGMPPTTVSVRTSVKEAALLMKENHTTAVLVQDQGQITGIFTSKDVVLRVIAPGLDPGNCSVVRVMTPHPDFAPMDMSIQAALRKMHDGHYLNLPVMNDSGEIVGMVDVLKLTYATLEQVNQMSTNDSSEGPAWNKFWLSLDNESESMVSGEGSHSHHQGTIPSRSMISPDLTRERINNSVAPEDSASHVGGSPSHSYLAPHPEQSSSEVPFAFKFKAPSGRVHRMQVIAGHGIEELVMNVASKLGGEVEAIGGIPVTEDGVLSSGGFAISYLDDEGDTVSITTDQDLLEAVLLARQNHRDKVDLFVHDPEKAPVTISVPQPEQSLPTPPESSVPSGVRRRRHAVEDEEEEESEEEDLATARRRKRASTHVEPDQVIPGVPNELLLPGAIVTLAVVIAGVFALGRATSR
ncbi:hypothetical protein SLS62_004714 [Diatrype stigma]|uniref:Uncharacterized protein n=1 Tax=Diatrype stigma TaxID=117547 RepID=A0AAN9YP46_9PEZI